MLILLFFFNFNASVVAQHQHPMGFDESKVVHHFALFTDGGAVDLSAKDTKDHATVEAVRTHAIDIAKAFQDGKFDSPMAVHQTTDVPGTADMTRLKAKIKYRYSQTPTGGRVDIVSTDAEARRAVHAFLRFQITEHKTGDSLSATSRKSGS